jgi:hypothetical protein
MQAGVTVRQPGGEGYIAESEHDHAELDEAEHHCKQQRKHDGQFDHRLAGVVAQPAWGRQLGQQSGHGILTLATALVANPVLWPKKTGTVPVAVTWTYMAGWP